MFRQIFLINIFLLLVCCQLCGQGYAAQSVKAAVDADEDKIAEFLKDNDNKIKTALKSEGATQEGDSQITVNYIQSAFLVAVNNVMVALAEVNYTEKDGKKINVVAKYIDTNSEKWGNKKLKDTDESWGVKSAGKQIKKINDNVVIKNFAVVVKDQKIYHITVSNNTFEDNGAPGPSPSANWHVRLIEGEVNSVSGAEAQITWNTLNPSVIYENNLKGKLILQPTELLPSDGFAFVTNKNKNIIFIMKGKTKDSSEKNITAIFQLEESGNKLKLLNVDSTEDCYPTIFQWKEKTYKTPTNDPKCSSGKVMEFNEDTNTFKDSEEPIASLLDFLKDKRNFTNAVIGANKVLLFTQQKSLTAKGDVNLWMYDGTRVGFVGAILKNVLGTFYGSLLYTDKGLFALHAKYQTDSDGTKEDNTFSLTLLKDQLKNITDTLKAWEESDKIVPTLCQDSSNDKNENTFCTNPPPTGGLVGFLRDTTNNGTTEWKDEYFYTNATVKNGVKVKNGLTFNTKGAGATWLVGKEAKTDQPYNFTDKGFTLVASVKIEKDADKGLRNSVLGVVLTEGTNKVVTKSFGLWCTDDAKWAASFENKINLKKSEEKCEQKKLYNVAFILGTDRNFEIYINEKKLTGFGNANRKIETSHNVKYFYFAADSEKDKQGTTDVTITNVLLYNRPFSVDEIRNLQVPQKEEKADTQTHLEGDDNNTHDLEGSTSETEKPSSTSATPTATEKDGAEIKLCSPLKNDFTVFALLLLVGFTLLARFV